MIEPVFPGIGPLNVDKCGCACVCGICDYYNDIENTGIEGPADADATAEAGG